MEGKRKKLPFVFVFSTYIPMFLLKFQARELFGCGIYCTSNEYPHCILFKDPTTPKIRNTWEKYAVCGIYYFWGSGVYQKYAVWVLVGCGIKFCIQWALSIEIWVKTQGDMSKIRTQKVVFFFLPPKLINIILLF